MVVKQRRYSRNKALVWLLLLLLAYTLVSIYWQQRGAPRVSPLTTLDSHSTRRGSLLKKRFESTKDNVRLNATNVRSSSQRQEEEQQQRVYYYPGRKIHVQHYNDSRPPLETLIQGENIVGDVQFLLDFAIVGFGKAGTSTMMDWLAAHPSVAMFSREVYDLVQQRPAKLVRSLYEDLPVGRNYRRGYKNPLEISQKHVLAYYRNYWPTTKMIVGLRHPVSWFESLYNFRVQNLLPGEEMPDPNHLIGRCYHRVGCCTEKANFAYSLLWLGKTNERGVRPMSPLVEKIVGHYQRLWFNASTAPYLPNPVFLYHLEQMQESPQTLARDVKKFLGLDGDLSPWPHRKPGLEIVDEDLRQQKERLKIDICDPAYRGVRSDLTRIGSLGAQWLEQELLPLSSTIHMSDPAGFQKILHRWSRDPCGNSSKTQRVPLQRPPKNDPIIHGMLPFKVHVSGQG